MFNLRSDKTVKDNDRNKFPDLFKKNGLETQIDYYTEQSLKKIKYSLILKPAIISVVAVIISFFLDLAKVPILGDISINIAKYLFPSWQPSEFLIEPFQFWWLPLIVYVSFVLLSYLCFKKLHKEVARTPATETIDRIVDSYTSIIDGISTALPLIGAAILLISIKLGEDIFLGLSVPFEIKALIILAIGKLFEPVLDNMSVEFQNVVTHIHDIKEKYFNRKNLENLKDSLAFPNSTEELESVSKAQNVIIANLEKYKNLMGETAMMSEKMFENFKEVDLLVNKISNANFVDSEAIMQLKSLAESISVVTASLNDERTVTGLKYLESMVTKK
ncbi:MAG: hypothetical protein IIC75_03995 [Bacteroidetes bacterium]|nr:hypothetical protein [Bacteroidota bacterium]